MNRGVAFVVVMLLILALSMCSEEPSYPTSLGQLPQTSPSVKVSCEPTTSARLVTCERKMVPVQWRTARVSWYGSECFGNNTANGTYYDENAWGVAHKTLPMGTRIELVYNGQSVIVPVFDRGPFVAGREFDLSYAVAHSLGFSGVHQVEWRIVR